MQRDQVALQKIRMTVPFGKNSIKDASPSDQVYLSLLSHPKVQCRGQSTKCLDFERNL